MGATDPGEDESGIDLQELLLRAARPTTTPSMELHRELRALTRSVAAGRPRRRRVPVAAGVLVPLLVLGGAGAAAAASGVDWSQFWHNAPAWSGWATHPDASVSWKLPSGGSCTMRIGQVTYSPAAELPAGVTADPAAADLTTRYLRSGHLQQDLQISKALTHDRAADVNWYTAPDGRQVHVGYGTDNYNPDVEYASAAREAVQDAIRRHLQEHGVPETGIGFQAQEQCAGMRQ